ncbi:helix-turn-helix domain-containing protein [Burkholderia cenocepacia]|uniref:helix-turn-helix domain-containing protein n=1 Tax=Burkholderia cenocepacia TaxID=95486 RepID=UPI0032C23F78
MLIPLPLCGTRRDETGAPGANGNLSSAARMLCISRAQLAYRLKRGTGKSAER